MAREQSLSDYVVNVGGGTTMVMAYLSLIPGFLPVVVLVGVVMLVVVLPLIVLGLIGAAVIIPIVCVWRLVARRRPQQAFEGAR
jgi:hypothetical protein